MAKLIQRICKIDDIELALNDIGKDPNLTVYETIPYRYIHVRGYTILDEVMFLIKDEGGP